MPVDVKRLGLNLSSIELKTLRMFLVGLTGGIATGKSFVSQILKELGCDIIDADLVAREVVEPGQPAWKKIKAKFGDEVILPDGNLNRERLGQIIFADKSKRTLLNSLTHPEIYKAILWKVLKYFIKGKQFVVLDLPLLYESAKMVPYISYVIVVSSNEKTQKARLMARNELNEADADSRINAQMPLAEKCTRATFVVDNSWSRESTKLQVEAIHARLVQSKRQWWIRLVLGLCVCSIPAAVYGAYCAINSWFWTDMVMDDIVISEDFINETDIV